MATQMFSESAQKSTPHPLIAEILKHCPQPDAKFQLNNPEAQPKEAEFSSRSTEEAEFKRNLSELRQTLNEVHVLLSETPTKETEGACLSLLNRISAINLPPEIKLKEAGGISLQLREHVSKTLKENGAQAHLQHDLEVRANSQYDMQQRIKVENLTKEQLFDRMDSFGFEMAELNKRHNQSLQNFLNTPLTEKSQKKFEEENQAYRESVMLKTQTIVQNFAKQYPNMTAEEKEKARIGLQHTQEELAKQEEEHRRRAKELENQAKQYPEGSPEREKYLQAATQENKNAQALSNNAKACSEVYQEVRAKQSKIKFKTIENEEGPQPEEDRSVKKPIIPNNAGTSRAVSPLKNAGLTNMNALTAGEAEVKAFRAAQESEEFSMDNLTSPAMVSETETENNISSHASPLSKAGSKINIAAEEEFLFDNSTSSMVLSNPENEQAPVLPGAARALAAASQEIPSDEMAVIRGITGERC